MRLEAVGLLRFTAKTHARTRIAYSTAPSGFKFGGHSMAVTRQRLHKSSPTSSTSCKYYFLSMFPSLFASKMKNTVVHFYTCEIMSTDVLRAVSSTSAFTSTLHQRPENLARTSLTEIYHWTMLLSFLFIVVPKSVKSPPSCGRVRVHALFLLGFLREGGNEGRVYGGRGQG